MPTLAYAVLTLAAPVAVHALGGLGLRLDLAVLLVISGAGFAVGILERARPWERAWNVDLGDTTVDVLHVVFSTIAVVAGFALSASDLGVGLGVWPSTWPLAVQVGLGLLIAELGAYWAHRWMHTTRLLWRVHLVHHSARRLHSLNASRNHPLDSLAVLVAAAGPLLVLGAPAEVLAPLGALAIVHLQFQHANTQLRLGPLNWILAGPELHRWHHSRVAAEANCNYGHVLSLWDGVFGTRLLPAGRRPPVDVGLFERAGLDERYAAQLAEPFR